MLKLAYTSRTAKAAWSDASDRALLESIRDGNEAALDELIGRKTKSLLKLAQRILGDLEEARDVVQVTFFKVWENRHKFDSRWSPNTWIYRIASNLAIDHLRSRRCRERGAEPVGAHLRQVADVHASDDLVRLQEVEVAEIFRQLAASTGLTENQRVAFLLHELEGLPCREIGDILGCQASTVRNYLFVARKVLREELLRRFPEYAGSMAAARAAAARPLLDDDEEEAP
jgi:RNA polymerase sigma-70 factor, ECF subfamily